jgi:F0F1-type ATP synthase membrane subunit b/b'
MHIPPDWGIFFALIASFLAFWSIFGWLFFRPFLKLIGDREGRLKELSERTERLLRDEKAAIAERERALAAVRREGIARRDSKRRRIDEETAKMIEDARAEARAQLEQVRVGIEQEFEAAARQLEDLARTLAGELAGRVLGRPVASSSQEPLNN